MPKKQKGGFILFAQEFKEEQRKKGVTYKNMPELVSAASPHWDLLSEAAKAKYKEENRGINAAEAKFTSFGQSFAEIDRQHNEVLKAEEMEAKEIKNIVELGIFDNSIVNYDFYVMDVNSYCFTNKGYVIAEFTIVRFNLTNGILDNYHEIVNPGSIPTGYASDAMQECTKLGIEMPFGNENRSNYKQIFASIIDYLHIQNKEASLPPIFTLPDRVAPVEDFILQMCEKAGQDETLFGVYRLPKLFYHLANAFKSGKDEGFPRESLALDQINALRFILIPGQACDHHEAIDKATHCTMSRVKCWIYTILDHCCPVAGIDLVPGRHVPQNFNLQKIQEYKEDMQNTERVIVAAMRGMNFSMDSASTFNNSVTSSLNNSVTLPKRVHKPVRKPKVDFLNLSDMSQPTTSIGRGLSRLPDYEKKPGQP